MTQYQWLSLITLLAWLVLALAGYRQRGVSGRDTLSMAIAWLGIFVVVILGFAFLSPGAE